MKKQGIGRIAQQCGNKGAFAEVVLEVESQDKDSVSFESCSDAERDGANQIYYSAAVTFGIRCALEKLAFTEKKRPGLCVYVISIRTMAVDSTEGFVAYAAAKAVYMALGRSDEAMTFDIHQRAVSIKYT